MDTEAETGGAGWVIPLRGSGTGAMTTGAAGAGVSMASFGSSAVTGAALGASSTIFDPVFFLRDRLEAALLAG